MRLDGPHDPVAACFEKLGRRGLNLLVDGKKEWDASRDRVAYLACGSARGVHDTVDFLYILLLVDIQVVDSLRFPLVARMLRRRAP